jgi:hypothetical protein
MADEIQTDHKGKPVRVQFKKGSSAEDIADAITAMQNDWAKRNPKKAHELYPNVYDENGKRIDGR